MVATASNRTILEPALKAVPAERPPASIDVREAMRRAVNSKRYAGSHDAAALRSWIHRLARDADPSMVATVAGRLWIHPSIHPAFSQLPSKDQDCDAIKTVTAIQRNKALAKVRAIRDFENYLRENGASMGVVSARDTFVRLYANVYKPVVLSVRSLARWAQAYRGGGIDAVARDGRGRPVGDGPHPEAVAMYWSARHFKGRKWSIRQCWRMVATKARAEGWEWFDKVGTCSAWDIRTRDERALLLNRQGEQAYVRGAECYVELDPESYAPLQCFVGDDHTFNCWVKLPNGKVVRPVLSAWMDWRARAIVGFSIVENGNEHALLDAFRRAAENFGLPETVIADNGKNFASYQWNGNALKRRVYSKADDRQAEFEGIFGLCGITPSWALPYNPNAKRIERFFRTLDEQLICMLPSYTGKNPEDRPGAHEKIASQAIEWNAFHALVAKWLETYNQTPHSGAGMDNRTPLQVVSLAPTKRLMQDAHRTILLSAWSRPLSINRVGVTVRICGASVSFGADSPQLKALPIGMKVRVAYDPNTTQTAHVWHLDGKFIATVSRNEFSNRSVTSETLRRVMRSKGQDRRRLREAQKVGIQHLRDPMELAIAGLAQDAERRRVPDGPGDGGPNLVPVQPIIEVPSEPYRLRKAVGAECISIDDRLKEFCNNQGHGRRSSRGSIWSRLERMAKS